MVEQKEKRANAQKTCGVVGKRRKCAERKLCTDA